MTDYLDQRKYLYDSEDSAVYFLEGLVMDQRGVYEVYFAGEFVCKLDDYLARVKKEWEIARTITMDEDGVALRQALNKGLLLVMWMRTFCDLLEPLDKDAAKAMGEFMREAESALASKINYR